MPWARLHALKDYLDMVEILAAYPDLHQTFNLVPSLVEQLEDYARGSFSDVYWDHTIKPAAELTPLERAFVVERMCEPPDHPRARSHPRYLELSVKRAAHASPGWLACAATFTVDEIRDLQIWFNLAWFEPTTLATEPLRDLVQRGRDFGERDKDVLAEVQTDILAHTLPAYREAAHRGQIELCTSPYFHPILPLLCNSDSARVASSDTVLPRRRFAHPEDGAEQIRLALEKHEAVFGERPRGMWCSEQAVGEDILPLLSSAGLAWTVSDESVLARSLAGVAPKPRTAFARTSQGPAPAGEIPGSPYFAYRLPRETGEVAMVFRDHTLSDLLGFEYRSWDSREAAGDMLRRLRELRAALHGDESETTGPKTGGLPLVTIALDGENAWEYYPRDGRDFLRYLYEGLSADSSFRCLTISEHLRESPALLSLDWLHTGSWIGSDLSTWSGDRAHCAAWDLLHDARDMVARRRALTPAGRTTVLEGSHPSDRRVETAWHHILVAEGSDWFWWFGEGHTTDLEPVWDLNFRLHLQQAYLLLDEPVPTAALVPLQDQAAASRAILPTGTLGITADGFLTGPSEWEAAGFLAPDLPTTMQRSSTIPIEEVRFGWHEERLCLMVRPKSPFLERSLEMELRVTWSDAPDDPVIRLALEDDGEVAVSLDDHEHLAGSAEAAWGEIVELSVQLDSSAALGRGRMGLVLRVGREGMTERVFHSAGLESIEWRGQ